MNIEIEWNRYVTIKKFHETVFNIVKKKVLLKHTIIRLPNRT